MRTSLWHSPNSSWLGVQLPLAVHCATHPLCQISDAAAGCDEFDGNAGSAIRVSEYAGGSSLGRNGVVVMSMLETVPLRLQQGSRGSPAIESYDETCFLTTARSSSQSGGGWVDKD
ncbi:hypothetical protein EK21DRAFT_89674 [Setomelanomma holmii]|uniref:Uncharacterized protein n=1 Tax=Setomelanomma holmii TaxID=210430 RepID=A0A9P4H8F5_9PLEO|nr:hypothetical protein EK21DRAFT_89674 [Setomelanomma holmii]